MPLTVPSERNGDAPSLPPQRHRLLIDAPTRMFHGLFALCFTGAYLSADSERWRLVHVSLGYALAGLLTFRLAYGVLGPRSVGWSGLWRQVKGTPKWFAAFKASVSLRIWLNQGLGVSMAWFVLTILALVVPLVLSGHAKYNEWGGRWMSEAFEELHEGVANLMLALVVLHLGVIGAMSLLRHHNHAALMWSGRVKGPGPDLVPATRRWLAALLLITTLAGVVGLGFTLR